MQRLFLILFLLVPIFSVNAQTDFQRDLARTYIIWQKAMVGKDYRSWTAVMAADRKVEVKNRILSERFSYPQGIFDVPVSPPSVASLKMLSAKKSGINAKAVFFGKINFNVGGVPEDNLLVVSYKQEGAAWKFVKAEYINLTELKGVRKEIQSGNLQYLNHPDFQPANYSRKNRLVVNRPVDLIAKVYAYCPGREVRLVYNERSNHLFQNTQAAEVAIGGAIPGKNEIKMAIKTLPGGLNKEPIAVRVYLLSQVEGVKPIKAYEYIVEEGGKVDGIVSTAFEVTPEMVKKIKGQ